MKVYVFYLRINEVTNELLYDYEDVEESVEVLGERCFIYAHTADKSMMKEFKKIRNMEMFFLAAYSMSKEEYEEFCSAHRDGQLSRNYYDVRGLNGETIDVQILTTMCEYEYYISTSDTIYDDFSELADIDKIMCDILYSLDSRWQDKIGIDSILKILDINFALSIGEPIPIPIDGLKFLLLNFDDIFKGE